MMKTENSVEMITMKDFFLKIPKILRYIQSKWKILLVSIIVGATLGFTYSVIKKPVYIATTTFVLEDESSPSGLGSIANLASIAGFDLGSGGGGIFQGDNLLELYKSRKMIERALLSKSESKDLLLIDYFVLINNLKENWVGLAPDSYQFKPWNIYEDSARNRLQDSLLNEIVKDISKNYLSVSRPDKKLNKVLINVSSRDEVFAKEFNNSVVKTVNDYFKQTKTKKSNNNINILQAKTDSVRNVMNGAIYDSSNILDATPNLNPTRQVFRVAPVQKAQFSLETNKAILSELIKNLELAKMTNLKETPLIEIIDSPKYPLYVSKVKPLLACIIGSLLGVFFCLSFLLLKKLIKSILGE